MLNKKCPICENKLKSKEGSNYCGCCDWYKEVTKDNETLYYIGDKRVFKETEKEDMHFFILLKRKELKDLIKRLNRLNDTFSEQAERVTPLCDTKEGELVWKNIQENKELALETLKKLTNEENN